MRIPSILVKNLDRGKVQFPSNNLIPFFFADRTVMPSERIRIGTLTLQIDPRQHYTKLSL
jgi:hypothetical protein